MSLPTGAPARLELLDVAGRVVATRRIEPSSRGAIDESFERSERVPAGVYLLRLSQGSALATERICVVR
jgi:hypothetical protein